MDDPLIVSIVIGGLSLAINTLVVLLVVSNRLGKYTNKVDTNCADIIEIKKNNTEVRDKVVACETTLFKKVLVKGRSPINLTEQGETVLEESGGKAFVDDNYPELKKQVEDKDPKTSYDIQEYSKHIIESMKNDRRLDEFKEYLFKKGMDLEDTVEVLGLYLRNRILKEKNISIGDIDSHNDGTKK